MRITRWGEYGLLCALYLGRYRREPVSAQVVADSQGVPVQYAQQILHRLKRGGVVRTTRGPHGGYELSRAPHEISLLEVLTAAEGDTFEVICDHDPIHPTHCGETNRCGLRGTWGELKAVIDGYLSSKTLASVLEHHDRDLIPLAELPRRLSQPAAPSLVVD